MKSSQEKVLRKIKQKKAPALCEKHHFHHGMKWPSCVLEEKNDFSCESYIHLPSGARIHMVIYGPLRAKDIVSIYKLLKISHNKWT